MLRLPAMVSSAGVGSLHGSPLGGNVQTKSSFRPIREGLCSHATVSMKYSAVSPVPVSGKRDLVVPRCWGRAGRRDGGPRVSTPLTTIATVRGEAAPSLSISLIIDLTSCASCPLRAGHSGSWARPLLT